MTTSDGMTDADIVRILNSTQVIAMVGASPNPVRPSHQVGQFLTRQGFTVIAVNPGQAGRSLFGRPCVASLTDISSPVDMVEIFRRPELVPPVVDEALQLDGLKTIWMQLDIIHEQAAARARANGIEVIMDRCPAIEIPRLGISRDG